MYIYIYNGTIVLSFVCLTGWFCRGRDYQVARIKPFISFLGGLGQALVSFRMTIRAETDCWPRVYERNLKWNNIKRLIKRQQPSMLECSNTHYFEWDNHTQHNDHSSLNVYIDEPILEPISGGRSKSTVTLAEFHNWCPNVSWKVLEPSDTLLSVDLPRRCWLSLKEKTPSSLRKGSQQICQAKRSANPFRNTRHACPSSGAGVGGKQTPSAALVFGGCSWDY